MAPSAHACPCGADHDGTSKDHGMSVLAICFCDCHERPAPAPCYPPFKPCAICVAARDARRNAPSA